MGYNIKLTTTVNLDSKLEKDIVNVLEELKKEHKIGEYVSNCIRVVSENPELAVRCGMDMLGSNPSKARKKYLSNVQSRIVDMEKKIDSIYKMCLSVYTVGKLQKDEQSKNMLAAQFILNEQLNSLKDILGIEVCARETDSIDKEADEILKYILEYHSDIIKDMVQPDNEVNQISEVQDRIQDSIQDSIQDNLQERADNIKEQTNKIQEIGDKIGEAGDSLLEAMKGIKDSIDKLAQTGIVSVQVGGNTGVPVINQPVQNQPVQNQPVQNITQTVQDSKQEIQETNQEEVNTVPQTSEEFEAGADWEALSDFLD